LEQTDEIAVAPQADNADHRRRGIHLVIEYVEKREIDEANNDSSVVGVVVVQGIILVVISERIIVVGNDFAFACQSRAVALRRRCSYRWYGSRPMDRRRRVSRQIVDVER
jgi:hypothetical protein